MRRFLMHVLPAGFVKIRHYGLLSSSHATSTMEVARTRLVEAAMTAPTSAPATLPPVDWRARLAALTGLDVPALRAGADEALPAVERRPRALVDWPGAGHVMIMNERWPDDRWQIEHRRYRRTEPARVLRQREPILHLLARSDDINMADVTGSERAWRAPPTFEAGICASFEARPPTAGRPRSP